LNIDIEHIGERTMTTRNTLEASRPVAVVMALALMATVWVPTLSVPSQADGGRPGQIAALHAAPVMM
jgi:hypothetical protein